MSGEVQPQDQQARMHDMRAMITGASSGIGAATARRFVAEGSRVALVARRPDSLTQVADELSPSAIALPADVRSPADVTTAVARAWEWLGGLDVVVNAAGVSHPLDLTELEPNEWEQTIGTNLSGTFFVAREAGLRMKAKGNGTIVNIGSELATTGQPKMVAYCASKAGVLGLTRSLAMELAPRVRVNAVCPGAVQTPMLDAEFELEADPAIARQEAIQRTPLARIANPDEIAAAILFLVVDAPFATGSALYVDGGTTVALQ